MTARAHRTATLDAVLAYSDEHRHAGDQRAAPAA
jgi:hypothetical protein